MIHLVIPDCQGGVYDYAHVLQGEMGNEITKVFPISRSSAKVWVMQLDDSVVLQMSGYGFSKRGTALVAPAGNREATA